mmetsp:Transcript_606/g.1544  ORF Transcript_606/g.1544 Transcript_606/m.1544 type:complete len:343 (+) Transcript_606:2246-3274(+)
MTDEDNATLKSVDCHAQSSNCLKIKMVRRLIHNDNMRLVVRNFSKSNTGLLSSRHSANTLGSQVRGNTILSQVRTHVVRLGTGEGCQHVLERAQLGIELVHMVLCEKGKSSLRVTLDITTDGIKITKHRLDQSTLTTTVLSENNNTRARKYTKVHMLKEQLLVAVSILLARVTKTNILYLDNLIEITDRGREAELKLRVIKYFFNQGHAVQSLDTRLCQGSTLGIVTELVHKLLHVGALRLLRLEFTLLLKALILTGLLVHVNIALVVLELLLFKVNHICNDVVGELAIVRNQDQSLRVSTEVLLKPNYTENIQMVSWLVQQEDVWAQEECGSQCHTHAPTS